MQEEGLGLRPQSQVDIDMHAWLPGIIHICEKKKIYIYIYIFIYICMYIHCNLSRYFSRKYAHLTRSYSLALFMHACSDSAIMLLCHALAYANGFCLHLLLVHGGVKKFNKLHAAARFPHRLPYIRVSYRHNYDKYIYIYGCTTRIAQVKKLEWLF